MKRKIIPYNPELKQLARKLRTNSTLAEVLLWQQLKSGKLRGLEFHRQRPIDQFIVDFFCSELMLAVEIDGATHAGNEAKDQQRQKSLESLGVRFLRFLDSDVQGNTDGVITVITEWIDQHTPPSEPEVHQAPLSRGD